MLKLFESDVALRLLGVVPTVVDVVVSLRDVDLVLLTFTSPDPLNSDVFSVSSAAIASVNITGIANWIWHSSEETKTTKEVGEC